MYITESNSIVDSKRREIQSHLKCHVNAISILSMTAALIGVASLPSTGSNIIPTIVFESLSFCISPLKTICGEFEIESEE